MDTHFQPADPQVGNDRLGFALFLAIAIHAIVIFGIGFTVTRHSAAPPSLDVTLALRPTDQKNDDATLLAQANQLGSGALLERKEITSDQLSVYDDPVLRDNQPTRPLEVPNQLGNVSQQNLITTRSDSRLVDENLSQQGEQQNRQLTHTQVAPAEVLSSLQARLDQQKQAYNKIPKILRLTSANTKAADHGAYLNYWIEKVEKTGNFYYPERARRAKLYGDILMVVTLLPDGSVENIEIVSSSGHSILDQAAITTVRLAAPFAAFPQRMSEWHKLEITRTWRYISGNRVVTAPN